MLPTPQLVINPIDQFRSDFYQLVIDEETRKAAEEKQKQRICAHQYTVEEGVYYGTYQQRTCSKCGHTAIKHIKTWEGTKRCVIS